MRFVPSIPQRKDCGVALVLVLVFLFLISALIISFFLSVTTELSGAKSYASGASARGLADSAVQISMAAVRQGSAGTDGTTKLAWASQPGMVRTFDDSGTPHAAYKLYSSDNMVVTNFPFDPATEVDAAWNNKPAMFTDLNAPVVNDTKTSYPVVDPSAQNLVAKNSFTITTPPGYDSTKPASAANNPAPMPTKWLYVLNNGQLTAPTSVDGTGKIASWPDAGSPGTTNVTPSASNPIVGRIAFWTDDDTCKVNINTAAGDVWTDTLPTAGTAGNPGSFWDVPRTSSPFEQTYLAQHQAGQNEFQRYPGHPATTYLSAVFPSLTTANIYQIAPRITQGGSLSGTAIASGKIIYDLDRLYSTVDELLFSVMRQTDPAKRDTNPSLTDANLYPAKFFLTAHSRAPEVNLFNQPRVVTWPISVNATTSYRTQYDNLFAYCGTLNGNPYYFQRGDPTSPTVDLPATVGSGGLGRNRALITYLRNLTSQLIPGFGGGTFLSKYPVDRDQILTEIFDYIRSLNAQDTSVTNLNSYAITSVAQGGVVGQGQIIPITDDNHSDNNTNTLRGFGRFPTVREANLVFVGVGQTFTKIDANGNTTTLKSIPPDASQAPATPIAAGKTRVQAFFALNFFDPSQGFAINVPHYQVRVTGLNSFQWNGSAMGFPSPSTVNLTRNYNTNAYGGYKGASNFVEPSSYAMISGYIDLPTPTANSASTFPFVGGNLTIEIRDISGATVLQTIALTFPNILTVPVPGLAPMLQDALNQDYRSLTKYTGSWSSPPASVGRFTGGNTNSSGSNSMKTWLCGKDVVRSVVANTDCRIIAATKNVSLLSGYYSAPAGSDDGTILQIHSNAECENGASLYPATGALLGSFVPNSSFGQPSPATADLAYNGAVTTDGLQPYAQNPSGGRTGGGIAPLAFGIGSAGCVPINGVFAGTNATGSGVLSYPAGDWDTGFSLVSDGPFINKADEGTIVGLTGTSAIPYYQNLASFMSAGGTFFSPNRQMPSAVMFGSLPTGVFSNRPWQTLLFHPEPFTTAAALRHIGAQNPPDHLLLDLFNMPVVEPYAISDPFSTAGKVNMNYQIVPFTYLKRTTGVRAVLRAEQMLALPSSYTTIYKSQNQSSTQAQQVAACRTALDLDQTLLGFQKRFDSNDIFRSASEVCSLYLVPQGQTYANMQTFWTNNLLTGDNLRERPYADIYPRLTTKSNTYTVHYRVQALKKVIGSNAAQWVEGKDIVTAEQRGSSSFERYLDTGDTTIPDYATATNPPALDTFYKFRVLESKQFTP